MTSYEFKRKILPILVKLSIGLGIGVFVIIIGQGWLFELNFLKNIDLLTIDLRYQSRYERAEQTRDLTKDGDVVIVGISDDDLKAFIEPFPFPRSYYAHIIKNLNDAGARTIIFDMTWESPSKNLQGDSVLRDMLQKYYSFTKNEKLKAILEDPKALQAYIYGRDVADLFIDFPSEVPPQYFEEIYFVFGLYRDSRACKL